MGPESSNNNAEFGSPRRRVKPKASDPHNESSIYTAGCNGICDSDECDHDMPCHDDITWNDDVLSHDDMSGEDDMSSHEDMSGKDYMSSHEDMSSDDVMMTLHGMMTCHHMKTCHRMTKTL